MHSGRQWAFKQVISSSSLKDHSRRTKHLSTSFPSKGGDHANEAEKMTLAYSEKKIQSAPTVVEPMTFRLVLGVL